MIFNDRNRACAKLAVVSKVRGEALSEEQLRRIQKILERAADDVRKVD